MHELSLAIDLVDCAERSARVANARAVVGVRLIVGALAGVESDALRVGFDAAIAGTLLEGARLEIEEVAVRGWCPQCGAERAPVELQWLACVECMTPLEFLTSGREIEITSLEIEV